MVIVRESVKEIETAMGRGIETETARGQEWAPRIGLARSPSGPGSRVGEKRVGWIGMEDWGGWLPGLSDVMSRLLVLRAVLGRVWT